MIDSNILCVASRCLRSIEEQVAADEAQYNPACRWDKASQRAMLYGMWVGIGELIESESFQLIPEAGEIIARYEKVRDRMNLPKNAGGKDV